MLKKVSAGFAVVEFLLAVVILGAVVGVFVYVMHQKDTSTKLLNGAAETSQTSQAKAGTTASIDALTQSDAASEQTANRSGDGSVTQAAGSDNDTLNSLGGAYDESQL